VNSTVTRGTIIFLSYGEGPHVAETVFSALSAWRRNHADRDVSLLIYTDRPDDFAGVPVELRAIGDDDLQEWQPAGAYPRRCKTAVVRDAVRTLNHPVALVDSDTWFRRSPHQILDRVVPGRVALHLDEGPLATTNCPVKLEFLADVRNRTFRDSRGVPIAVGRRPGMWNSGVTGIHPADASLLDDALVFLDQLWHAYPAGFFLEQFALSTVVGHAARPQSTADVVYHYWPEVLRGPWRHVLPELLADTADLPPAARAEVLHRHRPRARAGVAVKFAAKQAWRSVGLHTTSVRSSAT